jgi:RNA polymerase sigma-70 factor (ECF subfamily)
MEQQSPTPNSQPGFGEQLAGCLPALRARALKLCLNRSLADDLVQDTMVRALRFQSSFQSGTNLSGWTQTILTRVFLSRCRSRTRERLALQALRLDPNAWMQSATKLRVDTLSPPVERAVRQLPAKFGEAVKLVDLNELSYREAADELGVPVGTVMSRLFRGRRQLGQVLSDVPEVEAEAA